ncbi:YlxM family DNA-binding protein [Lactobacillus sp. PSON]|uniref:YlxM family DNA-binding protein n=1 Tax=Lactobacillus sp. PSON TaxID=3455454 RepID=UPI0040429EC6
MDELTKNEKLGDLYAYYGKLLTKGQQSYFEDYYYNDLSLGEIADNHNVSRQAIYDNLRRSTKSLKKYESTLHMQADYNKIEDNLELVDTLLDQGKITQAKEKIQKLLNKMRGE